MKKILAFVLCSVIVFTAWAQPFKGEIDAFLKKDSISFPASKHILFVGSSSFTLWKDVQDYFPGYAILNRGFGGSSITDLIYYFDKVILPYNPKQVVIYCGENDFAGDSSLSPEQLSNRFRDLFELIRSRYKKIPIAYVSMKPSPSRAKLMSKFVEANNLIKNFLSSKKRTAFIDVYAAMLDAAGKPLKHIFLGDQLHMNKEGYLIWQEIITPYLKK